MYTSIEQITKTLEPLGYKINDPWDIVDAFEKMVAEYAGSKYAVAVDNCTNAIFLCLKYLNPLWERSHLPYNISAAVLFEILTGVVDNFHFLRTWGKSSWGSSRISKQFSNTYKM